MKPLVIYHGNCIDGFTAAWAIWKVHPDWEFYPAKHGDPPPETLGRDVYMVDFSYKRPIIQAIMAKAGRLTILDHHKTAEADLADLSPSVMDPEGLFPLKVVFDINKSGARLAWEYFHGGINPPALVKYVEDRDLWRFMYPYTEVVSAYIFSKEYSFESWDELNREIIYQFESITKKGAAIIAKQSKDVLELSANKFRHTIAGYDVPVVNVPYTLASDMGQLLDKGEPFAATFYYDGEGIVFSLRSEPNGVDVSEVAKKFGGGGHAHAAGFKIKGPFLGEL